jgi:hypothetical protein
VVCPDDTNTNTGTGVLESVAAADKRVLDLLQRFLAEDSLAASTLVVLTRHAVAARAEDRIEDLPGASVWGLVRSAQSEHPGRFKLVDIDDADTSRERFADTLTAGEEQLVLREGACLVPRLAPATADERRLDAPPAAGPHRLGITDTGTLENLDWTPCPEVRAPLTSGQVRIAVQAAGVNFRDVTIALGLVERTAIDAGLGSEGSGVVLEVADDVPHLATGSPASSPAPSPAPPSPTTASSCPSPTDGPTPRPRPCPAPSSPPTTPSSRRYACARDSASSSTPRPAASAWPPSSWPGTPAPRSTPPPAPPNGPPCARWAWTTRTWRPPATWTSSTPSTAPPTAAAWTSS